jgi:hypothetical protein
MGGFTLLGGVTNLGFFFFAGLSASHRACPTLLHCMHRIVLSTILAKAFSGSCMQCLESCVEDAHIVHM